MSSWHTPERKTEQAFKVYLETLLADDIQGVQVATRFSNVALSEPRIEIVADRVIPTEQDAEYYTGNWSVSLALKVITHYESGVDAVTHDDLMGKILDVLMVSESGQDVLVDQLNQTQDDTDFTAQQIDIGQRTNSIDGHSLVTVQELTVMMAPSKL
jgi:hypothetical protein